MSVTDFLREAEAFRRLVCKEEREAVRRHELRDTFREIHDQLNTQLRAHALTVQHQLQNLRNDVFRFQEQLMDLKPSPGVIDKLKDTMTNIENSINAFKDTQHQSFEELLKDEMMIWQEIGVLERKIDTWCLRVKAEGRVPCSRSDPLSSEQRNLPPEVTQLEMFLQQTGGWCGGWDEYDHQSFMRMWTKHSGKASYRKEARLYLPGKSEEEVRRHEEWHLELRRLQEQKREAIRRWKTARQREREQQREQTDERTEPQEHEEPRLKQEEQRREVSERLEAWRSWKTQQREREHEERLRDQILQRRRAAEERRRQMELKITVEAHVQQRKEQEALRLLQEEEQEQAEREERHRQAAGAIRRFQERDSLRLEVKLQQKQSEEEERRERQRTLDKLKEKVEGHVRRDPDRLWRPTKVWQERMKEIGPSGAAPLTQMFHRAVPAWRQES